MRPVPDGPPDRGAALLVSPVRRRIVDTLANQRPGGAPQDVAGMTAAQLAAVLDLHVTTVRFHLDQLVAAGILHAEFSREFGVGRPRKVYAVAPGALDEARDHDAFRILAGLLAESLGDGSLAPEEAGRRWSLRRLARSAEAPADTPGRWLGKIAQMIDVLQSWGYTPELATSEGGRTVRVNLVRCPFIDLAREHPAVVCGIHRGLIAGAMESLGEDDTEVSLEPFVKPDLCRAHVRTRTPFRAQPVDPAPHPPESPA